MSALAAAALGAVYALGAWLAWDLARANLRHGHHEARLAPVVVGEGDPRFGSMNLADEPVVHHERPDFIDRAVAGIHGRCWPDDRSPELHAQLLADTEAWLYAPTAPPPSEAEVAASRAAHGYIPELDPGPEEPCDHEYMPNVAGTHEWCQKCDSVRVIEDPGPEAAAPAPGPDQRLCGPEQPQERERSPGNENRDRDAYVLGPRARAVLDGYEGRLGARKWACT